MKSKFVSFILVLIMLFLMVAIGIFAYTIYLDITNDTVSDVVYTVNTVDSTILNKNDNKTENYNITETSTPYNIKIEDKDSTKTGNINDRFFYTQLTDTQKKIYDGLLQNKEKMMSGTYKIQYGGIFSDLLAKEDGSKILGDDYQAAVESFLYDNPDVFYVDANKLYLSVETTTRLLRKTYNVYVGPAENSTYYPDGFISEAQVKNAKKRIEFIRDSILSNLTGNKYKDILTVHDYLVDNIEYDKKEESFGRYSLYGALIDKKCVCEGYAKAFKYLLNAANIYCEIAQGTATSSSGDTENHAWNCVYYNNNWYYVDVTWDDPIIVGIGRIAKSVQYKYFLKGSRTLSKDHVLSYNFSEKGRTYKYPKVSEYDYKE